MRFGFGFRSTNSSSGGSSSGGGSHGGINGGGHLSRGRSSKKLTDDRPFPPQLEEHPYFNYFPTTQQNYYTRYLPRAPPAYQLPPPPPAPPTNQRDRGGGGGGQGPNQQQQNYHIRQRHGSFSETQHRISSSANSQNFHFRSRSSSGRFRHMKTPNDYFGGSSGGNNYPASFSREKPHQHLSSKSNDQLADHVNNNNNNNHNNSEPIYSEPFPPDQNELNSSGSGQSPLLVSNGSKNHHHQSMGIKFFPDPHDPVQISNHIYEYLVSKRVAEERRSQDNLINAKRRGSLSSSPSDGSSTNNSKQPDFSSGMISKN